MNFRMQRFDWLARFFPMPRRTKRVERKKSRAPQEPSQWAFEMSGLRGGIVTALNRSEARSEIKKRHGLKRVPVGAKIYKVAA
jgi:hypothetical protein